MLAAASRRRWLDEPNRNPAATAKPEARTVWLLTRRWGRRAPGALLTLVYEMSGVRFDSSQASALTGPRKAGVLITISLFVGGVIDCLRIAYRSNQRACA
jgi:hypothetical protein